MNHRPIIRIFSLYAGLLAINETNTLAVTFAEALDATGLTWTTGGANGWFATNAAVTPTFDGIDAAASGTIGDNQNSWIQTTVNGPGVISWWWSASTEEGFDLFVFSTNNQSVGGYEISGEQNWEYRSFVIPDAGPVTLTWEFSRDDFFPGGQNRAYLDQVKFKTGLSIPLATALNTTNSIANWTTGGNSYPTYWEGQTNFYRSDGIAAESGAIYTSQVSWMETTVWSVTNVSFWWKVSSVTNHGWFAFLVNGVTNAVISGEVGWQSKTNIALPFGTNVLRWVSFTDPLAIGKLNRGWVDEVAFSPTFAPPDSIMLSTPAITNGMTQFSVTNKIGWPCSVYYSTNLAANQWTLLVSTNTMSSATFSVTDTGATNSPFRYYRAQYP